jgi:ubiquinone/menaquinone biosynthesis C-methylase UbiE
VEASIQRRIQRYGWDLAASDYERLWHGQLRDAQSALLASVAPATGERVLDVACGPGLITVAAAQAVGATGSVLGIDLSLAMVDAARRRAVAARARNAGFARMDGEALACADASFDVALSSLGLMYMPAPERALVEMRRVLRPGGRAGILVWGERARCGWAPLLEIVEDEVTSEVCPLFFHLGAGEALLRACRAAGFVAVEQRRIATTLAYADDDIACDAAFLGGPVALAWSRFENTTRARLRARYLEAIAPWRDGIGYRVPAEFVVALATRAAGDTA